MATDTAPQPEAPAQPQPPAQPRPPAQTPSRPQQAGTNWLFEIMRFFAIPAAIIVVGVLVAIFLVSLKADPEGTIPKRPLPTVDIALAESYTRPLEFEVDGRAVAYKQANISAQVSGRIVKKHVEDGQLVDAGEALLEIEHLDLETARRRYEAQLTQIEAQIEETNVKLANTEQLILIAQQQLEVEQRDLARLKNLPPGNVSKADLDAASKELLAADNTLQTLKNEKALLNAQKARIEAERAVTNIDLYKAKLDEERAYISAPFQGVIISEDVQVDAYVTPGQALITMEDTSKIEIECDLRLEQLRWIWANGDASRTGQTTQAPHSNDNTDSPTYPVLFQEGGGDFQPPGSGFQPPAEPGNRFPPELQPEFQPPTAGGQPDEELGAPSQPQVAPPAGENFGESFPNSNPQLAGIYALPQLKVTVILELGQEKFEWNGKLVRYQGSGINPRTRTVPCIVQVDDPRAVTRVGSKGLLAAPPALLRGMFVRLKIEVPSPIDLISVPSKAVSPLASENQIGEARHKVLLYNGGKLEIRPVRVVRVVGDKTLVISKRTVTVMVVTDAGTEKEVPKSIGLSEGEKVITTPLPAVEPGMQIVPRSEEKAVSPSDAAALNRYLEDKTAMDGGRVSALEEMRS